MQARRWVVVAGDDPRTSTAVRACDPRPRTDPDEAAVSFLALVDEAFRRLLDEPDAHLHVTGFAAGDVAFVLTRDGLEVRRRAEVYGSEN